jgi:hypothetical protein
MPRSVQNRVVELLDSWRKSSTTITLPDIYAVSEYELQQSRPASGMLDKISSPITTENSAPIDRSVTWSQKWVCS